MESDENGSEDYADIIVAKVTESVVLLPFFGFPEKG